MAVTYRTIPTISTQDAIRFWSQADVKGPNECWIWKGPTNPSRGSYGRFWIHRAEFRAPRIAYAIWNALDPGTLHVCHSCDNPLCVNPHHLWLGTARDNLRDCIEKGRTATGDRNGSRLHPDRCSRGAKHSAAVMGKIQRGARHYAARLTDDQILDIRRRYEAGGITQEELGKEYGYTQSGIRQIVRYQTRRDVTSRS